MRAVADPLAPAFAVVPFDIENAPKQERVQEAPKKKEKKKKQKKGVLPTTTDGKPEDEKKAEDKPFVLKDLNLKIPKGSFVGIVGRVGSGKSSLLQGLIGEMRRTRGSVGKIMHPRSPHWIPTVLPSR